MRAVREMDTGVHPCHVKRSSAAENLYRGGAKESKPIDFEVERHRPMPIGDPHIADNASVVERVAWLAKSSCFFAN